MRAGGLEVQQAQAPRPRSTWSLGLEMRERLAPAADLDVVVLVGADRHVGSGDVGQAARMSRSASPAARSASACSAMAGLERLDLGHQRAGLGLVLPGLGLADLLGGVVALGLGRLARGLGGAQLRVELQDLRHAPGRALRRPGLFVTARGFREWLGCRAWGPLGVERLSLERVVGRAKPKEPARPRRRPCRPNRHPSSGAARSASRSRRR